jgi:hypothetical protein
MSTIARAFWRTCSATNIPAKSHVRRMPLFLKNAFTDFNILRQRTIIHICGAMQMGLWLYIRSAHATTKPGWKSSSSLRQFCFLSAARRWRERERWDAVNQTAAQGFLIPVNFLLSAGKPFIFCIYIHAHHKKKLGIDLSNIAHHCTITWTDASITQVVR